jgi:hypothetical protein
MTPEAIAAGVVGLVAPYLAAASKEVAKKAADQVGNTASSLYQLIVKKFKGDADAEGTMASVEAKPTSEGRQTVLQEILVEKMRNDPEFAARLKRLLETAPGTTTTKTIVSSGTKSISVMGNVTNSTLKTGDVIADDKDFDARG